MSGHSKWSTIKHKKGAADAKRGQLFTKLSREIMIAAKQWDPNPDLNFRLRLAVDNAKSLNMPKDNIERAISKGSGVGSDSVTLEEITYEAYGPGGIGLIIQTLTDNKNRTAAEVRSQITRSGGNLAGTGSVSWNFEQKGIINISVKNGNQEEIALEIVDNGAEDFEITDNNIHITVAYENFSEIKSNIETIKGIEITEADLALVPNSITMLNDKDGTQTLKLIDSLEELDDVSKVFSNADFSDKSINDFAN